MAGDVRFNGRGGGGGTHVGGSTRSAWNVATTAVLATGWTVWQVVLQLIGGRVAVAVAVAVAVVVAVAVTAGACTRRGV